MKKGLKYRTEPNVKIQKYIPTYPLSNYIEHIFHLSGYMPIDYIKEMPDGRINLIIEQVDSTINAVYADSSLEEKFVLKNAWITGTQNNTILYEHNKNSHVISVHFTTGGFYALTRIPVNEIQHIGIEAELLLGKSFRNFYQRLINTENILEKFQLTEHYFLNYYHDNSFENSFVKYFDSHIEESMDWLVSKSGYSQKHLIHLTKTFTGFTPKFLQRLNRFQNILKDINTNKNAVDWSSLVFTYGFYDQAHFIKDFEFFSNISPTEYLNSQLLLIEDENPTLAVILQYPKMVS